MRGIVAALLGLCAASLAACRREPVSPKRDGAAESARVAAATDAGGPLSDVVAATLERAHVPAIAFAIVRDGKLAACEASGRADVGRGTRATTDTVFHAASLAKPLIGASALRLVEQGSLSLDRDVSSLLPFRVRHPSQGAPPITMRRLLTHTASVRDDLDAIAEFSRPGDPPLELRPFLARYLGEPRTIKKVNPFLEVPPGTRAVYSNVGAALAALAVESVTHERFDAYVRRTFFSPLRMTAAFRTSELEGDPLAVPHVWRGGDRFDARPLLGRSVYPASDLRATVCSLGRFVAAIAAGGAFEEVRVLERSSVSAMLEPMPLPTGGAAGLGWQRFEIDGRPVLGHEGEDDGASAVMAVDPERGTGAVVLANGDAFSSGDRKRAAAISELLARLLRP